MPRDTPGLEAIVILIHLYLGHYILSCGAFVVPRAGAKQTSAPVGGPQPLCSLLMGL